MFKLVDGIKVVMPSDHVISGCIRDAAMPIIEKLVCRPHLSRLLHGPSNSEASTPSKVSEHASITVLRNIDVSPLLAQS
jgi:hypothetical protein